MMRDRRRSRRGPVRQAGNAASVILVVGLGAMCGVAGAAVQFVQRGGDVDRLVDRVGSSIDRLLDSSDGTEPSAKPRVEPASRKPVRRIPKAPEVAPAIRKPAAPEAPDAVPRPPVEAVKDAAPVARPVRDRAETDRARAAAVEAEPAPADPEPEVVTVPGMEPVPDDPEREASPFLRLPKERQEAFQALVAEANADYDEALKHLARSDEKKNPDTWQRENRLALDRLNRAFAAYNRALDIFPDPALGPRVRDTNFKRVFCMKRLIE